ncbi:MAG: hypothetical protein ABSH12_08200, partial [Endomicrobiales bacterium]
MLLKRISNQKYFAKFITSLTLLCFTYSFIFHQAALGITMLVKESREAQQLENSDEQLLVPSRYGRITSGHFNSDKRLVIYIQDLHCNPEVQKNISKILQLFDSKYVLNKIFLEGAPAGKLDTSLLGSVPDTKIREKMIEGLLNKGLLSGAEYYSLKYNQDKLYGLEDWETYRDNLERFRKLSENTETNKRVNGQISAMVDGLKQKYLDRKLKKIEKVFDSEHKDGRYLKIDRLGEQVNEPVGGYPNISRYIEIVKLNKAIKTQHLNKELSNYIHELQRTVPMKVYMSLVEKMKDNDNREEFYRKLSEIAKNYTPDLDRRFPELRRYFTYLKLNCKIDPISMVDEENLFQDRVMTKFADRLLDKDLIFMSRMSKDMVDFADLKMTPNQFKYFNNNREQFMVLLQKYFEYDEVKDALALLDNDQYSKFYMVNFQRNEIFVRTISQNVKEPVLSKGEINNGVSLPDGYEGVLDHMRQFKNIDVVVAGGFHLDVARLLKDRGDSYLAITPNVTQNYDTVVYEQMMLGKIDVRKIFTSALGPVLFEALRTLSPERRVDEKVIIERIIAEFADDAQNLDSKVQAAQMIFHDWKSQFQGSLSDVTDKLINNQWTFFYKGHFLFGIQFNANRTISPITEQGTVEGPITSQSVLEHVRAKIANNVEATLADIGKAEASTQQTEGDLGAVGAASLIPLEKLLDAMHAYSGEKKRIIIGVDYGGTEMKVRGISVNENGSLGEIVFRRDEPTGQRTPEQLFEAVAQAVKSARDSLRSRAFEVLPLVGIGMPGRFIIESGDMVIKGSVDNIALKDGQEAFNDVRPARILTPLISMSVYVNNDAVAQMAKGLNELRLDRDAKDLKGNRITAEDLAGQTIGNISPGTGLGGGFNRDGEFFTDGQIWDMDLGKDTVISVPIGVDGKEVEVSFEGSGIAEDFYSGKAFKRVMRAIDTAAEHNHVPLVFRPLVGNDENRVSGKLLSDIVGGLPVDARTQMITSSLIEYFAQAHKDIIEHIYRGDIPKKDNAARWPASDQHAVKGTRYFGLGGSIASSLFGMAVNLRTQELLDSQTIRLFLWNRNAAQQQQDRDKIAMFRAMKPDKDEIAAHNDRWVVLSGGRETPAAGAETVLGMSVNGGFSGDLNDHHGFFSDARIIFSKVSYYLTTGEGNTYKLNKSADFTLENGVFTQWYDIQTPHGEIRLKQETFIPAIGKGRFITVITVIKAPETIAGNLSLGVSAQTSFRQWKIWWDNFLGYMGTTFKRFAPENPEIATVKRQSNGVFISAQDGDVTVSAGIIGNSEAHVPANGSSGLDVEYKITPGKELLIAAVGGEFSEVEVSDRLTQTINEKKLKEETISINNTAVNNGAAIQVSPSVDGAFQQSRQSLFKTFEFIKTISGHRYFAFTAGLTKWWRQTFGRDSAHASRAAIVVGEFDKVRADMDTKFAHQLLDHIGLFGRGGFLGLGGPFLFPQLRVPGKIPHRINGTDGTVNYLGVDQTSLLVSTLRDYLFWSGDEAYIGERWENLERLIEAIIHEDVDGDLLIENGPGFESFGNLGVDTQWKDVSWSRWNRTLEVQIYQWKAFSDAIELADSAMEFLPEKRVEIAAKKEKWEVRKSLLEARIKEVFWNEKEGYYYDSVFGLKLGPINIILHRSKIKSPERYTFPYSLGFDEAVFPPKEHAAHVRNALSILQKEFTRDWGILVEVPDESSQGLIFKI